MRRVRLIASGRVQGVFFRANTRDQARRLHLTGWVHNADDGTVVAEVQGEKDAVEALLSFCRNGPGSAEVTGLVVQDRPVVEGESEFEVR